ncbi:MAG: DUF2934 domain-containing protein [Rhodospirillaceae bacterium]|nr:DUF2934 domain-containing protein [Rhodospirillaceae bacterium]
MTDHSNIKIRARAYALWQAHGCEDGKDMDFWLQAERELLGAEPVPAAESKTETPPNTDAEPKVTAKPKAPAKPKAATKPRAPAKPKSPAK